MSERVSCVDTDEALDYARRVFRREVVLTDDSVAIFALDFLRLLQGVQQFSMEERMGWEALRALALRLRARARELAVDAELAAYIDESLAHLDAVHLEPPLERYAWREMPLPAPQPPTMAQPETLQYFRWLAAEWYQGRGAIVEFGTWLGAATRALLDGARDNPAFGDRKLYAFDSFRWAAWMDQPTFPQLPAPPTVGESFLALYRELLGADSDSVIARPCVVSGPGAPDGAGLPECEWTAGPIELLIFDLGMEEWLIERVWGLCAGSTISGRTILAINTYGNARSEGVRRFLRRHTDVLRPVHKPATTAKGFLVT